MHGGNEAILAIAQYMGIATTIVAAVAFALTLGSIGIWVYKRLSVEDRSENQLKAANLASALWIVACVSFTVTSLVAMIGM